MICSRTRLPVITLVLLLGLLLLSLQLGSIPINNPFDFNQVVSHRLVRALLAIIIGALLGCAGVLTQTAVQNPLASPDILGVSHGAALVAVWVLTRHPEFPIIGLPALCLVGGLLAAIVLKLLIGSRLTPIYTAICGVALSAWLGSISEYLLLSRSESTTTTLLWLTGSLWGRGADQLLLALPCLGLLLLAWAGSRYWDLLLLGPMQAKTVGGNPHKYSNLALLIAVLLTSMAVAVCGPIGFVGLVAPHLARLLTGGRHRQLLPLSMLVGALVLLAADLAGRTLLNPVEIPAGIMTALIGAPYFLWLLVRSSRS